MPQPCFRGAKDAVGFMPAERRVFRPVFWGEAPAVSRGEVPGKFAQIAEPCDKEQFSAFSRVIAVRRDSAQSPENSTPRSRARRKIDV